MTQTPVTVRRIYYGLTAGTTLATSLIWGINTIFLLDAGLSNFEAFTANAFFTAGMVLFEIPTGIVADALGRRASFLLGTVTLAVTTLLYVWLWQIRAGFAWWAIVSTLLGLGFTFFSGAVEAWLVDALTATGYDGRLDDVFARGQVVTGVTMLVGSVTGGYLAESTSLGVTYVARAVVLAVMFVLALLFMRDLGFTPDRGRSVRDELRAIMDDSVRYGLRVPAVRAMMMSGLFTGAVSTYVFYALQPYLLQLWGDPRAYGIAGLMAAVTAGAQIVGGLLTPAMNRIFSRRTSAVFVLTALAALALLGIGSVPDFWIVVGLIVISSMATAAVHPIRQTYLNGMIPSNQRATILSFDSLFTNAGGVIAQPALSRTADVWGYPASYLISAGVSAIALPFLWRARRIADPADAVARPAPGSQRGNN